MKSNVEFNQYRNSGIDLLLLCALLKTLIYVTTNIKTEKKILKFPDNLKDKYTYNSL